MKVTKMHQLHLTSEEIIQLLRKSVPEIKADASFYFDGDQLYFVEWYSDVKVKD